jgi:hypothetical protein
VRHESGSDRTTGASLREESYFDGMGAVHKTRTEADQSAVIGITWDEFDRPLTRTCGGKVDTWVHDTAVGGRGAAPGGARQAGSRLPAATRLVGAGLLVEHRAWSRRAEASQVRPLAHRITGADRLVVEEDAVPVRGIGEWIAEAIPEAPGPQGAIQLVGVCEAGPGALALGRPGTADLATVGLAEAAAVEEARAAFAVRRAARLCQAAEGADRDLFAGHRLAGARAHRRGVDRRRGIGCRTPAGRAVVVIVVTVVAAGSTG